MIQNLSKIVEEAYSELISSVKINEAESELVHAQFTDPKRRNFTLAQAKNATKFFVWLATEAGMELSSELSGLAGKPEKRTREPRVRKEDVSREERPMEDASQIIKVTKPPRISSEECQPPISRPP